MSECPKCGEKAVKYGKRKGVQRYQCRKGHVFTLESQPQPEPQPQQQYYEQPQPQPQDTATEIIGESEKPKSEAEPQPQPEQKPRDSLQVIGDFIAENLGNLIGDILNETVFKGKNEKKKEHEQSELDYI